MSKESPGFISSSPCCLTAGFSVLLSPPIFVAGLLSLAFFWFAVVGGKLKIEQNYCHLKVTKMS